MDIYLEYRTVDKIVVDIHSEMPTSIPENHDIGIVTDNSFKVEDKYDYVICINKVDENKRVTSGTSLKMPTPTRALLEENKLLKQENINLKAQLNIANQEISYTNGLLLEFMESVYGQ